MYFPIWDVPIEDLILNVDNKRFGAERDLVEGKLGRKLDPANNPLDDQSVVAILCDASLDVDLERGVAVGTESKDYLALREDWLSRKQAEPIWIRPDGTVRNGNRRLAVLKRLRRDGHDINWVEAIILDEEELDEAELFRMEQREQLTENFKKRYGDINALLALRQAAELENVDWQDPESLREVARRLKHYAGRDDATYALTQLQAVRAVDAYLEHIGVPNRYSLASRQVEVFREVGKCMSVFEDEPEDGYELVDAAFAFVQAGKNHLDLRVLRKIFLNDRERFYAMVTAVQEAEASAGWRSDEPTGDVDSPGLDVVTAPNDDERDDERVEPEAVAPTGYPKTKVGRVIDAGLDGYAATLLDVTTQLRQALARLEAIDRKQLQAAVDDDGGERVMELVRAIATWGAQALSEQ